MFGGLDMSQYIIWISIGIVLFFGICILNSKFRIFAKYIFKAGIGGAAIYGINILLSGFGFFVGINIFTIVVATFLGVPGIAMLYGLSYFI